MIRIGWMWLVALTVLAPAQAEIVVDVVKTGQIGKVGLDLSAVQQSGEGGAEFAKTLSDDLVRSGWFSVRQGAPVLVQASLSSGAFGGGLRSTCIVQNRAGGTFLKKSLRAETSQGVRSLAHAVADAIVEAVARKKGIASTRILMVGARGGRRDLYLCDADGHNVVNVTQRGAVCTSPAWTPDAKSLIFTWFVKGNPDVYTVDLSNRGVRRVAGFPGLNAGADVSPDGKRVVLTLSKDGNPELYVMAIGGGRPVRITRTPHAAEASPAWSPRGDQIVFVADQSGSPQLYVISANGGAVKRLAMRGSENVNPDWGPDGRIVFSSRRAGRYQVCVYNPADGSTQAVSADDADYEDPSWAPDSRHIVCTRTVHYDSDLYVLDTLGDAPLRLTTLQGDWHSPAWSPQ